MSTPELAGAKEVLLAQLREHALVIGEVTLSSGQTASYYVDARRAIMRPEGFRAAGRLIAAAAREVHADAVGGPVQKGTSCLVVEDTVTTGGSTVAAIERIHEEGLQIRGALCVVDRLAGGAEAIGEAAGAPFQALVTIDEIYPDRPDRA